MKKLEKIGEALLPSSKWVWSKVVKLGEALLPSSKWVWSKVVKLGNFVFTNLQVTPLELVLGVSMHILVILASLKYLLS